MSEYKIKDEEKICDGLRRIYESFGYSQYKMSKFEEYDLYVKNKSFLPSAGIITFTDTDGRLMALKPDVTLSIVKNSRDTDGLRKLYYNESVYRPDRGSHVFREIKQTGLECIGEIDNVRLFEVLTLAKESLAFISDDYIIDISHLGILRSVIDGLHLPSDKEALILQCISQKNESYAADICKAENVPEKAADALRTLMQIDDAPDKACETLMKISGVSAAETENFCSILKSLDCDKVRVDFSVINDLNYYNGIVFRGYLCGISSAVLSGGQYDNLMKKMDKNASAVGFAVYLDSLEKITRTDPGSASDAAVLYDGKTDLQKLYGTVKELQSRGFTVYTVKDTKAGSYKNVVDLRGDL